VDINSLAGVTSSVATSAQINIQAPAALTASLTALPATVKQLVDIVTVVMTVNNTGGAAANVLVPTITGTGAGQIAMLSSGPVPNTPQVISGGGNTSFMWTFSVSGIGVMTFSGHAHGTDVNSGNPADANSNTALVNVVSNEPVLQASLTGYPAQVSIGQEFTIDMTVTNVGLVDSASVTTSALVVTGGTVNLVSQPGAQAIPAGQARVYEWRYNATTPGAITFNGSAWSLTGDVNSNTTSAIVTSFTIPSLSIAHLDITPGTR
jgi:hypothetical protein